MSTQRHGYQAGHLGGGLNPVGGKPWKLYEALWLRESKSDGTAGEMLGCLASQPVIVPNESAERSLILSRMWVIGKMGTVQRLVSVVVLSFTRVWTFLNW